MALTAVAFTACSDPMEEITNVEYPRAFTPVELAVEPGSFDKATITWRSVDGARTYDVELSLGDGLEFSNIVKSWEGLDGTSLLLTDLWGETQYAIRVRANAFNEGQSESKWIAADFTTSAEQLFKVVKDVEVKGTDMIVRFELPHGALTGLAIKSVSGDESHDVALSAADIAAGYKEITGLTPNTAYTVAIMNGDQKRGEVAVTTQWKPTGSESNVVMVNQGDDLAAICSDVANIGKTIYLPDGFTFTTNINPGIVFAGSMALYGDPDAAVKPRLIYTATGGGSRLFTWVNNCNIDELRFQNIVFEGSGNSANGAIVFGSASATGTDNVDVLNAIRFERCDILHWGRAFYRAQGNWNNAIGEVSLNNCYAENVGAYGGINGNYAFFTMNVGGGGIDKIVVTNSTFKTVYHSFVNAPLTGTNNPCKSVIIENCTFNDFLTGPTSTQARIFIDGNNNTALSITLKGLILGQTGTAVSGYRYGEGGSIAVTNTFATSDYVNSAPAQLLPNLTVTNIVSTSLFNDAANGDFTIKNANFAGRYISGDPRWRP